ncbi:Protein of unknown function [Porphyromonadaceae bacterium NLAE-zl-C104]|uniref:DUF2442 domain-containing protein n=1 Tax=Proteiniphilum TaxID=294702 RepID=UPI0008952207|nr:MULTISPECIES: DUF2442 domain-containing protein [Proteiniphilum]MDY9918360.1 DUF2442 domain-containing protein [Proteiniphilum sp.]SDZ80155.1 Protein of unknown function [Porphyromonadaceae bacterium KH3R12]SFL03354.1 Protein of unknown function [Porphyromonadaceae bacterium KH3CP3RA]SFS96722.1 Protein of unknown function [Porphyromonadaceae bacterium NLAE-zl-C104]
MNTKMFTEIITAEYLEEYKLHVVFNNGKQMIVDFYDLLFKHNYPVFLPLRDMECFRNFKITDTIEWENGSIDIAPETVYEMGKPLENDIVAEP